MYPLFEQRIFRHFPGDGVEKTDFSFK